MFQHFKAGDNVILARLLLGEGLGSRLKVIHCSPRFDLVQPSDGKRGFRHVDTGDRCAASCHGFGENAAATADVDNLAALQVDRLSNPVQPQRIDLVQRPEVPRRVPPPGSQCVEFGNLCRIGIMMLR